MDPKVARGLALSIGVSLALLAGGSAKKTLQIVEDSAVSSLVERTAWCAKVYATDRTADAPCAWSRDLRVTSDVMGELIEPLTSSEVGTHRKTVLGRFGDNWAETKFVLFAFDESSVLIHATYDTDYGCYQGRVDVGFSSVHLHADALCFDLALDRMDGSARREQWSGQLPLE